MRIKKIRVKNYGNKQNFSASFSKKDKLIYVVENAREDDLFEDGDFTGFWELFFSAYAGNSDSFGKRNFCLEYECERNGKTFSVRAGSCFQERKSKGGRITVTQGVKLNFTYPADLDEETAHKALLLRERYLYPQKMREFSWFSPVYDDFDYPMQSLCQEVERGDDYDDLSEREIAAFKGKFRKFLREFKPVPLTEKYMLTFDKDGRCRVLNEVGENVEFLSADERTRAEFLSWATAVGWIREAAAELGREGEYPVLVQGLFWTLDEGKDKKMLFDALRKTGLQIFLLADERNEEIEKYCDKVLIFE